MSIVRSNQVHCHCAPASHALSTRNIFVSNISSKSKYFPPSIVESSDSDGKLPYFNQFQRICVFLFNERELPFHLLRNFTFYIASSNLNIRALLQTLAFEPHIFGYDKFSKDRVKISFIT